MEIIKDRVIQFIEYLGISTRQFEINCGLSNGMVNNIGENIRKASLDKISKRYPQLNINWLRTGEGEMVKQNEKKYIVSEPGVSYGKPRTEDRLLNTIERLTETNDRNSRSIEKMAETAGRHSQILEKLVNMLSQDGANIPDAIKKIEDGEDSKNDTPDKEKE